MKENKETFRMWYALSMAMQLGFLIVAPIIILVFLGVWGDEVFRTSPLFLFLGVGVGIGISVREVYRLLLPLIRDDDQHRPTK